MSETYKKLYLVVEGSSIFSDEIVIVLNRQFTREQIKDAMEKEQGEYSKEWIDEVITDGVYIPEGEILVVECKEYEKMIYAGFTPYPQIKSYAYIHQRDKVEIYPDATFKRIYYYTVYEKIQMFFSEKLQPIKDLLKKFERPENPEN